MTDTISSDTARIVLIAKQGLLNSPSQNAEKSSVLAAIRQIGALQIDTISVVARAPYFILWSRLGDFRLAWLEELLAEGQLFEYWAHAACFLPIEDFRVYRRFMLDNLRGYFRHAWADLHEGTIQAVLERIRAEGPLRSADFERQDGKTGTWWNWKEEKEVLEYLYTTGALMIRERRSFQRVYDLTERVMPGWDDTRTLSEEDVLRELTLRSVQILGVAQARWVPDYFRIPKNGCAARLEALAAEGALSKIQVEGWKDPGYVHPENLDFIEAAETGHLQPALTTLLSPFDPLISDRSRTKALFGFDYTIEVYVPAAKRRYGYYVLPILHRGRLVGRVDAKAHRQAGRFEIKALYLEPGIEPDECMQVEVLDAIQRCAEWHKTPEIVVQNSALPFPDL